jgi:RHS repeat-associated protein
LIDKIFGKNDWQVFEDKNGSSTLNRYVWSPVYVDGLVTRDRDTDANGTLDERLFALQDANWNVTGITNTSGTIQERYTETPYGAVTFRDGSGSTISVSTKGWDILHQGAKTDIIGDYDFRNRVYSPTLGRWLTNDPIGFSAGDVNTFRYVGNGPGNGLDPSGMEGFIPQGGSPGILVPAPTNIVWVWDPVRGICIPIYYQPIPPCYLLPSLPPGVRIVPVPAAPPQGDWTPGRPFAQPSPAGPSDPEPIILPPPPGSPIGNDFKWGILLPPSQSTPLPSISPMPNPGGPSLPLAPGIPLPDVPIEPRLPNPQGSEKGGGNGWPGPLPGKSRNLPTYPGKPNNKGSNEIPGYKPPVFNRTT